MKTILIIANCLLLVYLYKKAKNKTNKYKAVNRLLNTVNWNLKNPKVYTTVGSESLKISNPVNIKDGATYNFYIQKQGNAVSSFFSWGTAFKGKLPETIAEVNGKIIFMQFEAIGTNLYLINKKTL